MSGGVPAAPVDRAVLLRRHRATLIAYLHEKAALEDWHGVSDAANDLREVDVLLAAPEGR